MGLPEIIGGKARNVSPECMRCPMCSSLCPNKAIELHDLENVSKALASASLGVLSTFKKDKVTYVSFAKDITEFCDCLPGPGKIVMDDIGIFAADSPVSVDAAFLNMADYEIFNKAYGVDCFEQLKEAKKIGIKGELKPKIKKFNFLLDALAAVLFYSAAMHRLDRAIIARLATCARGRPAATPLYFFEHSALAMQMAFS